MEGSGGCNGGGGRDMIDGEKGGLCGLVRSLGYGTSHISTTLIRFDVPQHLRSNGRSGSWSEIPYPRQSIPLATINISEMRVPWEHLVLPILPLDLS